ncbi:MAG: hypothetical protein EPO09_21195, partial [Aquabacterium sp.]
MPLRLSSGAIVPAIPSLSRLMLMCLLQEPLKQQLADIKMNKEITRKRQRDDGAEDREDEEETWKTVRWAMKYEVSNLARVRGTTNKRAVKCHKKPNGYMYCSLYDNDGKQRSCTLHALVANAFLGKCYGKTINHINGNKEDARLCNLELATLSQQQRHRVDVLNKRTKGRAVLQFAVSANGNDPPLRRYVSSHEAERETGIAQG